MRLRRIHDGALLLTDPSDVRWASGFSGSSGWLVLRGDEAILVTDARYTERARSEIGSRPIELAITSATSDRYDTVARIVDRQTVGVRSTSFTMHDAEKLRRLGVELVGVDIGEARRTKDDVEIAAIRRAANIADRALTEVTTMIDVGVREVDVRDELDHRMRRLGALGPSYDTIVAAGPRHAAIPHHQPGAYAFEEGDPVVIDVGALVDGYHSDMTRTFVVGEPSVELREWYEAVAEAQREALEAIRPGTPSREIDRIARERFGDRARWFVHGIGHGVGLDIHEDPFLNGTSSAILSIGDVVTCEPGLYRVGLGGVRIEDLVVVRPNGADILTNFPKELLCLPSPPTT